MRQVYTRLNERLGLADHLLVLNVMLTKIGTNLKVFGSCEDVVEQTLTLFQARTHAGLVPADQPTLCRRSQQPSVEAFTAA